MATSSGHAAGDAQLKPYTFQYCKGAAEVGKSYEVHYVHSSASFAMPACSNAESQAPCDFSTGAIGQMTPEATTLNEKQAEFLPLANVLSRSSEDASCA